MRRTVALKVGILIAAMTVTVSMLAPLAQASAPGPSGGTPTGKNGSLPHFSKQYRDWLALKNANRIRSGVQRNQPKGSHTQPYVVSAGAIAYSYPAVAELSTNNDVPTVYEPGDGTYSNYGPGTSVDDDAGTYYGSDINFFGLCGPGAADIALYYWPAPPNSMYNTGVKDTSTGTTTTWYSERYRGYMTYVAWQMAVPGWSHPGMMDNTYPRSYGTTLYHMSDGLNWEASNHSNSSSYFYVPVFWSGLQASTLLSDVMSDINNSNVPVVAEVNAQMMANWTNHNGQTNHFITIIGYDNNQGIYYYTDTCGKSTGCGSNSDGRVQWDYQSNVWKAITNIQVNQSTDPWAGDGGWVW